MGDFEIDSGKSDSSNKPGGIGGTIFLILFATPFAGFGLLAAVQGVRKLAAGNTHDGLPLCLFGLIFSLVGFGLMFGLILACKKSKQAAELKARFADKPWMLRKDWADGKIKSSATAQTILYLVMAVAFCGIGGLSTCFALPDVWRKKEYVNLVALMFPAVGIGFLVVFVNALRSQQRFGRCFFELAQIPVPLGGILEGMIQTGKPLKLEHELNLKISCIRQVTTGSGKSRSTNEYILWQDEKIYSSQASLPEPEPGQTGIPVHFKLPDNQPESIVGSGDGIHWRLEAKSKMSGPNFHVVFDLPVFKTADSSVADSDTNEADPTASLQAPIEEIRRDENSKIKISDGPDGREFYFPAARNPNAAMITTAASIICTGIAVVSFHVCAHAGMMILLPIIFGLVGVLAFFGALSLWFKSSRVTIDSTTVRATNHWLIFSHNRQFSTSDVARFATKTRMQSGSQIFTDIKLIKCGGDEKYAAGGEKLQETFQAAADPEAEKVVERFREAVGPSGVTVAGSIASVEEANWLVAEMNKALGRK